jgi:hypothetical protein
LEIGRNRKERKKEEIQSEISEEWRIGRNRKGRRSEKDETKEFGIGRKGEGGLEDDEIGEGDPR